MLIASSVVLKIVTFSIVILELFFIPSAFSAVFYGASDYLDVFGAFADLEALSFVVSNVDVFELDVLNVFQGKGVLFSASIECDVLDFDIAESLFYKSPVFCGQHGL